MVKKSEQGSILLLVIMAVIILAIMGIAGLQQTQSDIVTMKNFQWDKRALFIAMQGINIGINELRNTMDPESITFSGTLDEGRFISGTLEELIANSGMSPQPVQALMEFSTPPATGMDLGANSGMKATGWKFSSTSELNVGRSGNARKEIQTAVVLISSEY
jgi:hypothetical protein